MYQIYFISEWHPTYFGQSFCPSSAVQDCTYSNRYMSDTAVCLLACSICLVATGICQTDTAVCLLARRQQYLFDIYLLQYVQSLTPDDGWKDRPKHVQCDSSKINYETLMHLVGFTMEIYYDARPCELQICKDTGFQYRKALRYPKEYISCMNVLHNKYN